MTEALISVLPDGAHVLFVVSAVENATRGPAKIAGFRGARYISAQASARGEWLSPGGLKLPGGDAYATSKQGNLATVLAFARETPRLRFNAVEPEFSPRLNLGRDASVAVRLLSKYVLSAIAPLIKYWSTPNGPPASYHHPDHRQHHDRCLLRRGHPMAGSHQVRDPAFQDRVVTETRSLLSTRDPA